MKKVICLVVGLVIVMLVAASCGSGITKDQYDKATSDLAAKTAELQAKTTELQAKVTELDSLNTKYNQANTNLSAANAKLTKGEAEIKLLNSIFLPAFTGEMQNMTAAEEEKLMQDMENNVKTIGDAALTDKFNALKDTNGDYDSTMAFFEYLLKDIEKTLQ